MHPKFTPNLNPNLRSPSTVPLLTRVPICLISTVHARSPGQPSVTSQTSNSPSINKMIVSNGYHVARNSTGQISSPLRTEPSLLLFLAQRRG
ncbi:hypothetical protein PVK06_046650 [Gossypium arboreum]|uniref:Uncharacterized protein n=1 Tax=Gossypium arboreum TaxID=29729 RepID=A0ABR0MB92_GOSAR|nr:hypothetical protein PVK06_046650 [Gossypium arboreum]